MTVTSTPPPIQIPPAGAEGGEGSTPCASRKARPGSSCSVPPVRRSGAPSVPTSPATSELVHTSLTRSRSLGDLDRLLLVVGDGRREGDRGQASVERRRPAGN